MYICKTSLFYCLRNRGGMSVRHQYVIFESESPECEMTSRFYFRAKEKIEAWRDHRSVSQIARRFINLSLPS